MKYFWLEKHLNQWHAAINNDHKPQAVIVSGAVGTGKNELMRQMAAGLVCRKLENGHCGNCQNCTLFEQGYHPDVHIVAPEKNVVKVKMIRELTEFFTSTPHCSDFKIAVIRQANSMNTAAANALLKVLEEPPSRGILFLVTDTMHQLMPTIKSRCIVLDVSLSSDEKKALLAWVNQNNDYDQQAIKDALVLTDFQPLTALEFLHNDQWQSFNAQLDAIYRVLANEAPVSSTAKEMLENQHSELWTFLQRYLIQLLKTDFNQAQQQIFTSHPLNQLLKKTPKVIHIIIKIADLIQQFMLNLNTQIKAQLMLESMLVDIKNEIRNGS